MGILQPDDIDQLSKGIAKALKGALTGTPGTGTNAGMGAVQQFRTEAEKFGITESMADSLYRAVDMRTREALTSPKNIASVKRREARALQQRALEGGDYLSQYATEEPIRQRRIAELRSKAEGGSYYGHVAYREMNRLIDESHEKTQIAASYLGARTALGLHGSEKHVGGNWPMSGSYAALMFGRMQESLDVNTAIAHLKQGEITKAASALTGGFLSTKTGKVLSIAAAPIAIRHGLQGLNALGESSYMRRVGNPTMMGIASGLPQGAQSGASDFGSYISSLFAAPSLLGIGSPDSIGSIFGTNMSAAAKEGWQMRGRAFRRALNPFDMLSQQQSMDIVQGVSRRGFRPGTRISVEEALSDIVQRTAVDANDALNILDISVKRLGVDVKEAKEFILGLGPAAKAAGKDIQAFSQETFQNVNTLSSQGAMGPGALQASSMMSSISQVSGPDVMNFLNSAPMSGLTAAVLAPNASMSDQIMIATGNEWAIEGGQSELKVFKTKMKVLQARVKTYMAGGFDKRAAIALVANENHVPFQLVEKIMNSSGDLIRQAEAYGNLNDNISAIGALGGDSFSRAIKTQPAQNAFKQFQMLTSSNYSTSRSTLGERFDLGGKMGPGFEGHVFDLFSLMKRGDTKGADKLKSDLRKQGLGDDLMADVERAAGLMLEASHGKQGAWTELNKDYGLRFKGQDGKELWNSSVFNKANSIDAIKMLPPGEGRSAIQNLGNTLKKIRDSGLMRNYEAADLMQRFKAGDINLSELKTEVESIVASHTPGSENMVTLQLTPEAKHLVYEMRRSRGGNPASVQDGKSNKKPGYNIRSGMP